MSDADVIYDDNEAISRQSSVAELGESRERERDEAERQEQQALREPDTDGARRDQKAEDRASDDERERESPDRRDPTIDPDGRVCRQPDNIDLTRPAVVGNGAQERSQDGPVEEGRYDPTAHDGETIDPEGRVCRQPDRDTHEVDPEVRQLLAEARELTAEVRKELRDEIEQQKEKERFRERLEKENDRWMEAEKKAPETVFRNLKATVSWFQGGFRWHADRAAENATRFRESDSAVEHWVMSPLFWLASQVAGAIASEPPEDLILAAIPGPKSGKGAAGPGGTVIQGGPMRTVAGGEGFRGTVRFPNGRSLGTPPEALLRHPRGPNGERLPARINVNELMDLIPPEAGSTWIRGQRITHGSKFQFESGGKTYEIKFHAPDPKPKLPSDTNARSGWTAQIKVNGKYLDQDGFYTPKVGNKTHIPLEGADQ